MAGPGFFDTLGRTVDEAGAAVRAFSPTALARRLLNNPDVMEQVGANLPAIAQMNPALAARIEAREPEAILEAYQLVVQHGGAVPAAARQMDLPFKGDMPTAMAVYGTRGRGTPVGGPTGAGVTVPGPTGLSTQVTPRTRIPGPPQRRLGTTAGVPVGEVLPTRSPRSAPAVLKLESPDVVADRRAMERLDDAVQADQAAGRAARAEANRPGAGMDRARQVAADVVRRSALPVAAGVAGVGIYQGMQNPGWLLGIDGNPPAGADEPSAPRLVPDITRKPRPMSTADLAAETSPPPSVEAAVPTSPREQAHALQRQLNEMRAAAGGEVPEAPAMRREIQRLFDMADAQTNAAARSGVAPQGGDPLSAARRILADLNAGRIPPAQRSQAQAEMQRLYRLADAQANAQTAARRAG